MRIRHWTCGVDILLGAMLATQSAAAQPIHELMSSQTVQPWVVDGLGDALRDEYPEVRAMALATLINIVDWPFSIETKAFRSDQANAQLLQTWSAGAVRIAPAEIREMLPEVASMLLSDIELLQQLAARVMVGCGLDARPFASDLFAIARNSEADSVARLAAIRALAQSDQDVAEFSEYVSGYAINGNSRYQDHALAAIRADCSLFQPEQFDWFFPDNTSDLNTAVGLEGDRLLEVADVVASCDDRLLGLEAFLTKFHVDDEGFEADRPRFGVEQENWDQAIAFLDGIAAGLVRRDGFDETIRDGLSIIREQPDSRTASVLAMSLINAFATRYEDDGIKPEPEILGQVTAMCLQRKDAELEWSTFWARSIAGLPLSAGEHLAILDEHLNDLRPDGLYNSVLAMIALEHALPDADLRKRLRGDDVTKLPIYILDRLDIQDGQLIPLIAELDVAWVPGAPDNWDGNVRRVEIRRIFEQVEPTEAVIRHMERFLGPRYDGKDGQYLQARLAAVRYVARGEPLFGRSMALDGFLERGDEPSLVSEAVLVRSTLGTFNDEDRTWLARALHRASVPLLAPKGYGVTQNFQFLAEEQNEASSIRRIFCFASDSTLSATELIPVLQPTQSIAYIALSRYWGYVLGGGAPEARYLMSVAGRPLGARQEAALSSRERVSMLLDVMDTLGGGDAGGTGHELLAELGYQIASNAWREQDEDQLRLALDKLESGTSGRVAADAALDAISSERKWRSRIFVGTLIIAAHAALWTLLFFLYPRSEKVRAVMFWNRTARVVAGLKYVDLIIALAPPIQRRLLAPFADRMIEDADLDIFEEQASMFFPEIRLAIGNGNETTLVDQQDRMLGTRTVLIGDSGAGKSHAVRWLLWNRRSLKAKGGSKGKALPLFIRARDCDAGGVLTALAKKVEAPGCDETLLRVLLRNGAINLYIDGLNEASYETQMRIIDFVKSNRRTNALITTQPTAIDLPSTLDIVRMPGVSRDQITDFLGLQLPIDRGEPSTDELERYRERCASYVEETLAPDLTSEETEQRMMVLGNPLDLTDAASLLWEGRAPRPDAIRDRQFESVCEHYMEIYKREFPTQRFSEAAFEATIAQTDNLDAKSFDLEISALSRPRMVIDRASQRHPEAEKVRFCWFRHDKIRDYFIARHLEAVLSESDSPSNDLLCNTRLAGGWRTLCRTVSLEAAVRIRDLAIELAIGTGDRKLSDDIVRIVGLRKRVAP